MTSRQWTLFAIAFLVVAIPFSHNSIFAKKKAVKKGPAPKVAICHFSDDDPVGHVIEVSANALPAHLEKHGDCTAFVARPNGACRCLTCEERCEAAGRRCAEACEGDPQCIADCRIAFNRCVEADGEPEPEPEEG